MKHHIIRALLKHCVSGFLLIALLLTTGCEHSTAPGSALLMYGEADGKKLPVKSPADWEKKRQQILEGMELAMGKLPDRTNLLPLDIQIKDSVQEELYTRYRIHFTAAKDEIVPAYLYIPAAIADGKKHPAMLALHGTGDGGKDLVDGTNPETKRPVANELAQRGYIVIAPDYPSMGELKDHDFANDRYESGTMQAIFNHMRCVDLLQSREDVDPERIGVIGHSLGGHNSMFVGAFDKRLKVIVSSCGWTLMDYYDIGEEGTKRYGGRLGPWAQDRYMPLLRDNYQLDADKIPFDFDAVIAALAPRAFFSNSPLNDSNFDVEGVREGITSASEVYRLLGAPENLQVRYPDAGHDFTENVRLEAYRFIDNILSHTPNEPELQ